MGNLNNGYIGHNNLNEEYDILGVVNSRRAYLDSVYKSYKYDPEWERPSDWLALPEPAPGTQQVIGLFGVKDAGDEANRVAVRCQGAYTVDWGDGALTSHTSNGQASHEYNYASIDPATTTSTGVRQVIITITPQGAGNLTYVDLDEAYPGNRFQSIHWLDIVARIPNCSSLYVASTSRNMPWLERFRCLELGNPTSAVNMFYRCFRLRVVEFPYNSSWTNLSGMFTYCNDLRYGPILDTSNVTLAPSMFSFCTSLKHVPQYDFSKATNISGLFSYCSSLKYYGNLYSPLVNTTTTSVFNSCFNLEEVGDIDVGNATNLQTFFYNCYSLRKIKSFTNSSSTTSTYQMFYNCYRLVDIPAVNTQNCTTTAYMYAYCGSASTFPLTDTSNSTNTSYMFFNCNSLVDAPAINTASSTNFANMFYGCSSLKQVPLYNTSSGTNFAAMFYECRGLFELPAFDMSAVTSNTGIDSNTSSGRMVYTCYGLSKSDLYGQTRTQSYADCNLGRNNIVTIFNNLGTAAGTQTITVRYCPGAPYLSAGDISIATGKGWTVVS